MRHKKNIKHFNRSKSHYKLMFRNMCNSIIKYKKIKTTLQKAKKLRKFVEKIINISKINNLNNYRRIFSLIRNKDNTREIFNIGKKFLYTNGGYLRIIKYYKFRKGDNANMAIIKII